MDDVTTVVRYFAGAKAAAGVAEERIEPAAGTTLGDLVDRLTSLHPDGLPQVLRICSFLVDGVVRRDPGTVMDDSTTVDVLPPFAGG